MNRHLIAIQRRARITAEVEAHDPEASMQEKALLVEEWIEDELRQESRELAEDREFYGEPEDTPCVESADMRGTGEGRYHGLIG